jgi:hypothetical protein
MGALVDALGLDFGDSTWLRWRYTHRDSAAPVAGNGFGFYSRHLNMGRQDDADEFDHGRTFFESVAEYHAGNVDHFHSYLSRGPRVAILTNLTPSGNRIEIKGLHYETEGPWTCRDVFIVAVCVVSHAGKTIRPRSVQIHDESKTHDYRAVELQSWQDGRDRAMFVRAGLGRDDSTTPDLATIRRVIVEFGSADEAANAETVFLIDGYGPVLRERLAFLRDHYNVESQLVTEHAGQHFRGRGRAKAGDAQLQDHMASRPPRVGAFNGTLLDHDGNLVFSTDADVPHSFARVLPELCEDLETRFLMPFAGGTTTGLDLLDLTLPLDTRTGARAYDVRRMMPAIPDAQGERLKSKRDTFSERLAAVLAGATEQPGLGWPIYTHLGNLDDRLKAFLRGMAPYSDAEERKHLPSPYFEWGPLHELQDRVFNLSGSVAAKSRCWFTRASVLYDYALMLKTIGPNVTRPDSNIIEIRSWTDKVLDKMMPRAPSQLYGITFYVDDPAKTKVLLDGKPLALLRNPPDETGRGSVTIAEAEIRTMLFGRVDPVANLEGEAQPTGGEWRWTDKDGDGLSYGRLETTGRDLASLRLPLHGLTPAGAQIFGMTVRANPRTQFGVLVETRTGGRFFFGDETLLAGIGQPVTAGYHFKQHGPAAGQWRTLLAPLWDLSWVAGAKAGGPMPNHPLEAVTILCRGASGATLDITGVAFLRPRATALSQKPNHRFCLGGRVEHFAPAQRVHVSSSDGSGVERDDSVDQRGFFCFPEMPAGVYRVWSEGGGKKVNDPRGMLVEVSGDVMNLVLKK